MNTLDRSRLLDVLRYYPETGVFKWRSYRGGRAHPDRSPGTIDRAGYRIINIDGKHYYASRLAFFYVYGRWPSREIDHINRNTADDRIENLREASRVENMSNTNLRKGNKSGFRGVVKVKNRWWATIKVGGKSHFLGSFQTPEEASKRYQAEAQCLRGSFFPIDQQERTNAKPL
jgi:hypothetical protein